MNDPDDDGKSSHSLSREYFAPMFGLFKQRSKSYFNWKLTLGSAFGPKKIFLNIFGLTFPREIKPFIPKDRLKISLGKISSATILLYPETFYPKDLLEKRKVERNANH